MRRLRFSAARRLGSPTPVASPCPVSPPKRKSWRSTSPEWRSAPAPRARLGRCASRTCCKRWAPANLRERRSASASAAKRLRPTSIASSKLGPRCGPASARVSRPPRAASARPRQLERGNRTMSTVLPTAATNGGADLRNAPTKSVYLDYQATTPLDPRVLDAMMPYFTEKFGNPHSRNHPYGWEAEEAVEKAREQVAELIHADPREIVFTSGATESNNLAIAGVARFYKDRKNHIVTAVTEHKCVLDTSRHLEQEGFEVTYLPVKSDGLIDLEALKQAITAKTALVSIMGVNNE